MTIAFITEVYLPTASSTVRSIESQRQALEQHGHTVRIIAPSPVGIRLEQKMVHTIPSVPFPGDSGYHLTFPALSNAGPIIEQADIVHAHHPFTMGSWAQQLARQYHKPFVFTNHDYLSYQQHIPVAGSLKKRPLAAYLTQFANASTIVIVPTSKAEATLKAAGVTRPIHVIMNGINTDQFSQGHGERWRAALGIPHNHLLAIHVGPLTSQSTIPLILQSLAQLDETYQLVLVGDGPDRTDLEQLAAELGIAHRIYFLGQIGYRSMPDIYAGADVLITATTNQARVTSLLEAQAAGLPVIATQSANTHDIVRHTETALITESTRTSLTHALRQLNLRPALRHTLAAKARQAAKRHSIQTTSAQLLNTYQLARKLKPITR